MEELNHLRLRMDDIREEMKQAAKELLPVEFKKRFDEWPEAEAFRWTQYTPYFNDGDACVFSVNQPYVKIGDERGDQDDGYLEAYDFDPGSVEWNRMKDIEGMLESCEDVLEELFGDHCQVTIWRDKNEAEVEEYSHD